MSSLQEATHFSFSFTELYSTLHIVYNAFQKLISKPFAYLTFYYSCFPTSMGLISLSFYYIFYEKSMLQTHKVIHWIYSFKRFLNKSLHTLHESKCLMKLAKLCSSSYYAKCRRNSQNISFFSKCQLHIKLPWPNFTSFVRQKYPSALCQTLGRASHFQRFLLGSDWVLFSFSSCSGSLLLNNDRKRGLL